jgi:isoprenylcysteine carboxyl methyltransferase (ICMT) family protein YpbQ
MELLAVHHLFMLLVLLVVVVALAREQQVVVVLLVLVLTPLLMRVFIMVERDWRIRVLGVETAQLDD